MDSFVPSWIQVVFIEVCVTHEAGSTQAGAIPHLVTKLSFKSLKKKWLKTQGLFCAILPIKNKTEKFWKTILYLKMAIHMIRSITFLWKITIPQTKNFRRVTLVYVFAVSSVSLHRKETCIFMCASAQALTPSHVSCSFWKTVSQERMSGKGEEH